MDMSRWEHHRVVVRPEVEPVDAGGDLGLRIHFVSCHPSTHVDRKGVILLIHGFPETWYQFRHVITPLSDAGYHVVAPDYRGAGDSTKPSQAEALFTKQIMAQELHTLVTKQLGIRDPIHVVGHDIGGMVAHAYAVQFPDDVASVCWGECPLPGTTLYQERKASPIFWHFVFHTVPDLPELLISGKVREYLKHFFDRLCYNPGAVSPRDLDVYELAYSSSGGMRCGLGVYRAFERDSTQNKIWLAEKGKSRVRCLALWGEQSFVTEQDALNMCREFYMDAEFAGVPKCGHWIAEEQPELFTEKILDWVAR